MELTSPCHRCNAQCCQNTSKSFACILDSEDLERSSEVKRLAVSMDAEDSLVIPYVNGKCPFLSGTSCGIYTERPNVCRAFNCVGGYGIKPNGHSFFLEDHPNVVTIIEQEYPELKAKKLFAAWVNLNCQFKK